MRITEYKPLYQDITAFFGVRKGVIYNGFAAADGTPINHYGMLYRGLGTAQEKCRESLGPYAALAAMGTQHCWVEGPVQQRNPRNQYATQLMWGFDSVKGIEDKADSRMRGTNMQTLESGELTIIPRAPGSGGDIGLNQTPYQGQRYSDRLGTQYYPYSATVGFATSSLIFRYNVTQYLDAMVADVIPLDGLSRFASLTYQNSTGTSGSLTFEPKTFKVFEPAATGGVLTEVGKVIMNSSNDGTRAHVGYGIPLDESLIERDPQGNAIAYHLFYGKQQSGGLVYPGKLIYKKIGLRPFAEPVDEVLLEDITTGAQWPGIPGTVGNVAVKIEGRSFVYSHAGVRYLVVFYKMGRHVVSDFPGIPFTVKRAVLTDGVAGAFETFTFPVPFPNYGNALVLSPNRKTLWHYSYDGVKIACLKFGADVTLESDLLLKDNYISAIAVDDNQCLLRTDANTKYVIRPGAPAPDVSLSLDKTHYAISDTAVLTVTTTSVAPITVNIEVTGVTEKSHTKTISASTPATISLTVTGIIQACMVN